MSAIAELKSGLPGLNWVEKDDGIVGHAADGRKIVEIAYVDRCAVATVTLSRHDPLFSARHIVQAVQRMSDDQADWLAQLPVNRWERNRGLFGYNLMCGNKAVAYVRQNDNLDWSAVLNEVDQRGYWNAHTTLKTERHDFRKPSAAMKWMEGVFGFSSPLRVFE